MPLQITIVPTGSPDFLQKVAQIVATGDFSKPMKDIGDKLVYYYSKEVFASQGAQFGEVWTSLAPSTMLYKSKHYTAYASVPLIATGAMQNSFQSQPSSRSLSITNSAPYFVYHQSSAPRSSSLPRRQMIGVNDDIKSIIKQSISDDLKSKLAVL